MKILSIFFLVFPTAVWSVKGKTLLVSDKNDILKLDLRNNTRSRVVGADMPVVAFDVHESWRQLYWATDYHLYRTPLYDLDTTTLIAVTGRVGSLTVDWVHNHIYWTDLTASRVEAAHLDGRGRRVVHTCQGSVTALALDSEVGKLFWIESIPSGPRRIQSSNLDGSQVHSIYTNDDIYEGSPIAVDVVYKSIYFYKLNGNYSEQWEINYQGIEPQIKLFEREDPPPRSLVLDKEGFFYSNKQGLFSGTWVKKRYTLVYGNSTDDFVVLDPYFKVLAESLAEASQIRVFGEGAQPSWQDDCSQYLCEQDCVPVSKGLTDRGTTCVCRYGYTLAADNVTCDERGYVLYSTDPAFGRLTLDGEHLTTLFNESSMNTHAFDVHIRSGTLYWIDFFGRAMYRAPVELPERKHVVMSNVSVYGMAVDWVHDHLYWTESSRIMVADLDGRQKLVLLKDLDSPAKMAVDPVNKRLFWAECGLSHSIKSAGLDGSDVTQLVRHVTCGASLSADPKSRTLYWLDWKGALHSCNYDGSQVTRVLDRPMQAMALLGENILFVPLEEDPVNSSRVVSQFFTLGIKPTALKVVRTSEQPLISNSCEDTDCSGLCIPFTDGVPLCLCPDEDGNPIFCNEPVFQNDTDCGGTFRSISGILQSPNYPGDYPDNMDCTWIIQVPQDMKIKLTFEMFDLEGNSLGCNYDSMEIRDGPLGFSPVIGRFCGNQIPPDVVSSTNGLRVRFSSDEMNTFGGFRATWDAAATGCGGTLSGSRGSITSPNYPLPYPNSVACVYKVSVAKGSQVRLSIVDVDLEPHSGCAFDYIEVFDGLNERSKSLGRFCSDNRPTSIMASTNHVIIKFVSDMSTAGRGFHINYNSENLGASRRKGYLELVNSTSFSVTLRCAGSLLTHPVMQPFLRVVEVDSLVSRGDDIKQQRVIRVDNKTLPFTIDNLNPATTYNVSVVNRVTRASFSLTVHTPPPPLAVERLPSVQVPGIERPIPWREQGVHFNSPNAWEHITHREFILLLLSKKSYSQASSTDVPDEVLVKIKEHFSESKDNFMVLNHYKSEEEFDDDPTMYLANIPWGAEYWLAMVQVTDYKGAYNLDFVFSERFSLPDPYWKVLMEKILDEQD